MALELLLGVWLLLALTELVEEELAVALLLLLCDGETELEEVPAGVSPPLPVLLWEGEREEEGDPVPAADRDALLLPVGRADSELEGDIVAPAVPVLLLLPLPLLLGLLVLATL